MRSERADFSESASYSSDHTERAEAEGSGDGERQRSEGGGNVLVVDDDSAMCEALETALRHRGFEAAWRTSGEEALALLEEEDFDVVISDISMQGMSGIELCERIASSRPDIPVIVVTAYGSMETAVAAIRAGAYDYVTKPFELEELTLAVERAIQHRSLREEVRRLRRAVADSQRFGEMIGTGPAMKAVFALMERVADTDASVLITGETGTGKELVARALHERGPRQNGAFVAVNCAAMPETLLESELFGHVRGAFTDAKTARPGLFVVANGGTIFLDEIGEMPPGMQAKLLRVLQERTVRPVGGSTEVHFDARLVTATNRDLEQEVAQGRFREDLFYRINVVRIDVPPLRMRGNDVLLLAQHFIQRVADRQGKRVVGLSSAAAEKLLAYDWPGNARELENCVERAVTLTQYDTLQVEDLPDKVRSHRATSLVVASEDPVDLLPMEEIERRYIQRVLRAVNGNKTLAAKILGFDRRTLYRKLERSAQAASSGSAPHRS